MKRREARAEINATERKGSTEGRRARKTGFAGSRITLIHLRRQGSDTIKRENRFLWQNEPCCTSSRTDGGLKAGRADKNRNGWK